MTQSDATVTTIARCPAEAAVKIAMLFTIVVVMLLMLFGLAMRLSQAALIPLDPAIFYQLMTAHGIGMVGIAGMSGAAIMWYFLSRHVALAGWVFWALLGLWLAGVVLILGSIFIGGFAGAWTFLFPLPANSGGMWSPGAAAVYLVGVILVGVGFLLFDMECGRAIVFRYGSLGSALGWRSLFGGSHTEAPPPTVIASASIVVFNSIGTIVGAAVLTISLINLYFPSFGIDALLAKNLIYFFGHVFINASIYMAVIAVYEIVPEYAGKPWRVSKAFIVAWSAVILLVMTVYPHHLLQDAVMPRWALALGQIVSYASGIPLLVMTTFSLLTYIYRSRIRWDLASSLLVLGVFGWSIGSVPAIIDGMVSVNNVMHNTQWVPGHFHLYLLLGEVAMAIGFVAWLVRSDLGSLSVGRIGAGFLSYVIGGLGFCLVLLVSGSMSVPRRWATHLPEWQRQSQLGSLFAVFTIVGFAMIAVPIAKRLAATLRS